MGPKYKSEGENEHGGKWEYAGDPDTKTWHDWQDHKLAEKSSEFEYSDSTREHIDEGESQNFRYKGNDLPEKM